MLIQPPSVQHGYVIEWSVGYEALETSPGSKFDPVTETTDVPIGINIAIGDVDNPDVGDKIYGIHHENWIAGQKTLRTRFQEFAMLWLLH